MVHDLPPAQGGVLALPNAAAPDPLGLSPRSDGGVAGRRGAARDLLNAAAPVLGVDLHVASVGRCQAGRADRHCQGS